MAQFQQPPTYADPVIVDERTGKSKFNPIWLKWFLELIQVINASGGGSGSIVHNDTTSKQGGGGTEFYHATASEYSGLQSFLAGTYKLHPTTDAGAAQTGAVYQGTGVPNNANGNDGDYYFRKDGTAAPTATKDHLYFKTAGAWGGVA